MMKISISAVLALGAMIVTGGVARGGDAPVSPRPLSAAPVFVAGTPWQGELGIRETVGEIMGREGLRISVPARPNRVIPLRTNPARRNNPQDPNSAESQGSPPRKAAQSLEPFAAFTPQLVTTINFTGATLADTGGSYPPDSMGAAGPTQYIVAVNGRIRSFNKTNGVADNVLNADMDVFFNSVRGGSYTSDPRIRYDRLSGRWFIVIINVSTPNRILIAVSDGSSAGVISNSTIWTFFYIPIDTTPPTISNTCLADYPTLGIDADALYIGTNNFCGSPSQTFDSSDGYVVNKSSVINGGPLVVTVFRGLVPAWNSDGPYTPQGVDNYDPLSNEGYFIGVSNTSFGRLVLRRVSNPGTTPGISGNINITVDSTYYPLPVPQQGSTTTLDPIDDRLFAAHIRNGELWTAHNIDVDSGGIATSATAAAGGRTATRWYELSSIASPGTPTVVQSGTVYDSSATNPRFYWIPSIMVSGQGHAALGFSTSGNNEHPNAATVGRLVGDTLGTMQTPQLYTNSTTVYDPNDQSNPHRWGDYSYTSLDPDDDMTMWTIQEFCNATNSYGVQVVKLLAPPPATPSSASPSTVAAGEASVNVTVTGTSVSGSEFFDPGAGFPNHISASVPGTTVNSVTYTDPTHVTVNLSTVGSSAGARSVTVTNPDGQSVTSASPILAVCSSLTISPSAVPMAVYNTPYSLSFSASGGTAPYTFNLSGSLPAGIGFSGATLSGTTTATGGFLFTLDVTDANGCTGRQSYILTVVTYPARVVETTTDYSTIQAAYNSDMDGSPLTIRVLAAMLSEDLNFSYPNPVALALRGGNSSLASASVVDYTYVSGSLTVGTGSVTVDYIVIH